MSERNRRHQRSELQHRGVARQPRERRPTLQRVLVPAARVGEVIGPIQPDKPRVLGDTRNRLPPLPIEAILPFEHQTNLDHPGSPSESVLTDRVSVPLVAAQTSGRCRIGGLLENSSAQGIMRGYSWDSALVGGCRE